MTGLAGELIVRVLVPTSACRSGDGRAGSYSIDDIADRLAGLGGGGLLSDEHVMVSVRQRAVDTVGRHCGELVLRRRPSSFGVLQCGQDDERSIAQGGERLRLG